MTERDSASKVAAPPAGRGGSRVLSLLATPLNVRLLRAHAEGRQRLPEIQEKIGWPPQSTLRVAIRNLRDVGALRRHELPGAPYTVVNELTPAGEELLSVAAVLEAWLALAPDGPMRMESSEAKAATKALAEGWSSRIVRMLALHPASLSDLDRSIAETTYPSLERRLARLRVTGQVEPAVTESRGTPFQVTDWLRRSVGPLCGAARWEQRHLPEQAAAITGSDIETVLLLAIRLPLSLPPDLAGQCFLGVPEDGVARQSLAGLMVEVEAGMVTASTPEHDMRPRTWILGTAPDWLDAIVDGGLGDMRIGGTTPQLAVSVAQGIHFALFKGPFASSTRL